MLSHKSHDLYQVVLNRINDIQKTLISLRLGIFSEVLGFVAKGLYVIYVLKETETHNEQNIDFDVKQS